MKAAFGAEAIGLGHELACNDLLARYPRDLRTWITGALGAPVTPAGRAIDPVNPRPWLAEIVGLHRRYRFERRFLPYKIDYSQASGTGNRGVWFWWTLESGRVYETWYRTSWQYGRQRRYLTVTDDGQIKDLTEDEVRAWLSGRSTSTS